MERVPAASGWHWIRQGFALFRRQPAEMATLFVLYCCFNLLMYLIPLFGAIASFVLIPIFSMAFMSACRDIELDKRVHPKLLFAVFRNPALKRLLGLGSCYLLAIVVAIVLANLSDNGYLFEAIAKQVENPPTTDAPVPQDMRLMKSVRGLDVRLSVRHPAAMVCRSADCVAKHVGRQSDVFQLSFPSSAPSRRSRFSPFAGY